MTTSPQLDPRGLRFSAAISAVFLALALATAPSAFGLVVLALQTALFAIGALRGASTTPTAYVFRTYVRPHLGAPGSTEDAAPPRFAQGVGLLFTGVALVAYLSGATLVGEIALGFALLAALLNAVLGLCLGCELYGVCAVKSPTIRKETATHIKEAA